MDAALLMLSVILLASLVKGQLDFEPAYDYQSAQLLGDDDIVPKDYLPVQSPQEQKFLEGLVIEAGRHVLFPELYTEEEGEEEGDEDEDKGKMKVIEMKGQPEFEESYMNEKARRAKKDCPVHCTFYKPVCGSDGKVYESECHLRKENCGVSRPITSGSWQICRGKHYLCPFRCLDINDPVCGSDGRIYHNSCVMRKRNCGRIIEMLPVRKCYDNIRQSKEMSDCPEECPEIYRPACGSDGVIYYNSCFLRKRTCKLGIVEVEMDGCVYVPKCPEVCLAIYDPVCGSDGRLYINQCRMLQENCGKEIKVMARTFCGYPSSATRQIAPATRQVQ